MPHLRIAPEQPARHHPQALQVVDGLLDPVLAAAAYEQLKTRFLPPVGFFWVDLDLVVRHRGGDDGPAAHLAEYLPREASLFVLELLARLYFDIIPEVQRDAVAGFEVGNQITGAPELGPQRLRMHFDCDARLLPQGLVRGPAWSTVYHLGPREGLVGGETTVGMAWPVPDAVVERAFLGATMEELLAATEDWVTVPFRANRLVVFHGILPHFRKPVRKLPAPDQPRISVVAAVYDRKVLAAEGCCPFPPRAVKILHALRLREQMAVAEIASQLSVEDFVALAAAYGRVLGREPGAPDDATGPRVVTPRREPPAGA